MNRFTAFLCAALIYPKKAFEGLPWISGSTLSGSGGGGAGDSVISVQGGGGFFPSRPGGWFHHAVNEWVENVRDNTRLWSCFLAFANLAQFIVILILCAAISMLA